MGNLFRKIFSSGQPSENRRRKGPKKDDAAERKIKVVLVGASTVGKTCLIVNYNTGTFNEDRVPNVLDVYKGPRTFEDKPFEIEIIDTSGDTQMGTHR